MKSPEEGKMRRSFIAMCALAVLGVFAATSTQAAVPTFRQKPAEVAFGGGNVLPAQAMPKGYSLFRLARVTAAFNTTDHSSAPPKIPFQMLYWKADGTTFQVRPGTMLYVPILYNSDSPPVLGNFPDPTDRDAVLHYWYSQDEFGVVYANVTVDGETTSLGPDYLMAMQFAAPLPDTSTRYMTTGAVLTPLTRGRHTVTISALATGAAVQAVFGGDWAFTVDYTVIVR